MSSWLNILKTGLKSTSSKISEGINHIFHKKKLDKETLEQLEELLISADIGVKSSAYIVSELSKQKFEKEIEISEIKIVLSKIVETILEPVASRIDFTRYKPHVVLVCGVNGNGKTTTIGKIAAKYHKENMQVVLGACDTFRAAAQDQLRIWAERSSADLIEGQQNSDPASVAFKALEYTRANDKDILLIDTAGRLSNKAQLMDELAKVGRVLKKLDQNAPHDTILVIDATTGYNAISQVAEFSKVINITGLIITKLDGSAKAGIIIPIAQQFNIPIVAIGVGESIESLHSFIPKDFAKSLVGV